MLLDKADQILLGHQQALDLGFEQPARRESMMPIPGPRKSLSVLGVEQASEVRSLRPRTVGAVSDVANLVGEYLLHTYDLHLVAETFAVGYKQLLQIERG